MTWRSHTRFDRARPRWTWAVRRSTRRPEHDRASDSLRTASPPIIVATGRLPLLLQDRRHSYLPLTTGPRRGPDIVSLAGNDLCMVDDSPVCNSIEVLQHRRGNRRADNLWDGPSWVPEVGASHRHSGHTPHRQSVSSQTWQRPDGSVYPSSGPDPCGASSRHYQSRAFWGGAPHRSSSLQQRFAGSPQAGAAQRCSAEVGEL